MVVLGSACFWVRSGRGKVTAAAVVTFTTTHIADCRGTATDADHEGHTQGLGGRQGCGAGVAATDALVGAGGDDGDVEVAGRGAGRRRCDAGADGDDTRQREGEVDGVGVAGGRAGSGVDG